MQGDGDGEGDGDGGGFATTGPVPESGGTTKGAGLGVGFGGLSPGSRAILRASVRYQLRLVAPMTTSAGFVYQRFPGTPASA